MQLTTSEHKTANNEGTGILTLQTSKGVVPSWPVVFNPPRDGNLRTCCNAYFGPHTLNQDIYSQILTDVWK